MSTVNTCTFKEIENKIKASPNLWLIGEYKWSLKLLQAILKAETDHKKAEKTGIFLTDKVDNLTSYSECNRLVFFNHKEQFTFISCDNHSDLYYFYHSTISGEQFEIKNITKDDKRFDFAKRIEALNDINSEDKINVIFNQESNEWRLTK